MGFISWLIEYHKDKIDFLKRYKPDVYFFRLLFYPAIPIAMIITTILVYRYFDFPFGIIA